MPLAAAPAATPAGIQKIEPKPTVTASQAPVTTPATPPKMALAMARSLATSAPRAAQIGAIFCSHFCCAISSLSWLSRTVTTVLPLVADHDPSPLSSHWLLPAAAINAAYRFEHALFWHL